MTVVADNNILALFVDSGNAQLLHKLVGQLKEPGSIVSPDLQDTGSEFNRRLDIQERRKFVQKHGKLWVVTPLTLREEQFVIELSQSCKKLRRRRGDLEVLVLGWQRKYTILTDDHSLRKEAQQRGVTVMGSCGLLMKVVQQGILTCKQAADLYNHVFKRELGLFSTLEFRCPQGICV